MTTSPLSIGFISLGCAKNLVDSQVMAGVLLAENLQLAPSPEEADIILINTCAFIEDARTEAAEAILRACRHKAAGGCRAVIVAGCLPQRYRDRVAQTFPDVDAFLGVDELDRVGAIARQVAAGRRRLEVGDGKAPTRLFASPHPGLRFSGGPFAYLKVAEGCNHTCAFCAIPGIRGRYRSRPQAELVAEAGALLTSGVRELNLISQDTTSYGRDRRTSSGGETLPALLRALDARDGAFWIRVLYGYPSRVSDALLEAMAGARHVCAYLDLPIQHSHPEVLRAMQRADAVRAVTELPQRLRRAVPGMVLRTTCLVGFPGETEAHFQHLMDYVAAAKFDHLGVFAFSPEEGTAAFGRADTPPTEVAAERRDRLLRLQKQVVEERRRALVGTRAEALLLQPVRGDGRKGKGDVIWLARLARQAPEVDGCTHVRGVPDKARPGDFLEVRLTGGRGYDLAATAVV
jgi:ribosomal protein S12 methylthiotransferase